MLPNHLLWVISDWSLFVQINQIGPRLDRSQLLRFIGFLAIFGGRSLTRIQRSFGLRGSDYCWRQADSVKIGREILLFSRGVWKRNVCRLFHRVIHSLVGLLFLSLKSGPRMLRAFPILECGFPVDNIVLHGPLLLLKLFLDATGTLPAPSAHAHMMFDILFPKRIFAIGIVGLPQFWQSEGLVFGLFELSSWLFSFPFSGDRIVHWIGFLTI